MKNKFIISDDNYVDDCVDVKIAECLNLENPKSFFLFAGAGSGKTRSLVKALEIITTTIGEKMRLRGQQVGVITYTNNACDEIKRRLKNDSLLHVSTIHSFMWNLIRGFNADIKEWLKTELESDISKLMSESSREGSKKEINRVKQIASKRERLQELDTVKIFTYNPNSNDTERESLNHTEVLQLGAFFLTNKSLMQKILIKKFPILLIDECQDTNKGLMEAFFRVWQTHKNEFLLGLFGDTMQRIFSDGKPDLGIDLPADWEKPAKIMNHRSYWRIVKLINVIRSESPDSREQWGRKDKEGGFVRLFIVPSNRDKQDAEAFVMQQMAIITRDSEWNERKSVTSLILEHQMAADRLGFGEMFSILYSVDEFRQGLLKGTLPEVRIFSEIILPILEAHKNGDKFTIADVVKNNSRLFKKQYVKEHTDKAKSILETARNSIDTVCRAYDNNPDITLEELLKIVYVGGVFEIPRGYKPILLRTPTEQAIADVFDDETDEQNLDFTESSTDKIDCLDNFLKMKFSQIQNYVDYVKERSPFYTHQGVKGLEFPRVMVIIDDAKMGGFTFSYDKLFGIKDKTNTDTRNARDGKETSVDKTRRLFYVICSRAKESLAVVAYTAEPAGLKANLSGKGWFTDDEIFVVT